MAKFRSNSTSAQVCFYNTALRFPNNTSTHNFLTFPNNKIGGKHDNFIALFGRRIGKYEIAGTGDQES